MLFVGDEAEKQALLLGEPELFFTTPSYESMPLVMLRLAEVDVERPRELVTDAWLVRAPDALRGDLDQAGVGRLPHSRVKAGVVSARESVSVAA